MTIFFSFERALFTEKHLTNSWYLVYCSPLAEDSRHATVLSDALEVEKCVPRCLSAFAHMVIRL